MPTKKQKATPNTGIKGGSKESAAAPTIELFGHVTLIEGYVLPTFIGFHALIALRDSPGKTIAVMSSQHRLQTLLETALATGNLVDLYARKLTNPPTPRGGTWGVDVYHIDGVILYNFK
ncbi:MAG: hypothetical protein ICV68_05080 [Pyrinomonadaceae bacterium]|nr:hypothetical protein [Pyrinomonadaceae bacterium]